MAREAEEAALRQIELEQALYDLSAVLSATYCYGFRQKLENPNCQTFGFRH